MRLGVQLSKPERDGGKVLRGHAGVRRAALAVLSALFLFAMPKLRQHEEGVLKAQDKMFGIGRGGARRNGMARVN